LNNLQPSYMTFVRPRRNPAGDSRYAFTALARGAWDGRWEEGKELGGSQVHNSTAFRGLSRRGKSRREEQSDSRFDPRYGFDYTSNKHDGGGIPLPSFAPLPNYTGGDDMSSVGGDGLSVYSGFQHYKKNQRGGFHDLYISGGPSSISGESYLHDVRSQADAGSLSGSIDSRRF